MLRDIYEIEPGKIYRSRRSGIRFRVLHLGKHAQDCSIPMVVYLNLDPAEDTPAGRVWTIEESLFYKRMGVRVDDNRNELYHRQG